MELRQVDVVHGSDADHDGQIERFHRTLRLEFGSVRGMSCCPTQVSGPRRLDGRPPYEPDSW